ncbi:hypothetical protein ZOSMA_56G00240 [Zostera marina]|uniref:Ferric reductase NAD binding domain-containing protein n=1 Tax=Zostera marina TaxID=29655 RepID=A0A0K9NVX4_ZOSMR|nr:hypothetical protein ZOSMA_56G00240 [Zostera marina]
MIQSLNHAKTGVDVVSGTHVKSHFAKPKWYNVYKRIGLNNRDKRIGKFVYSKGFNHLGLSCVSVQSNLYTSESNNISTVTLFYETRVFYCGNPVLTKEFGNLARDFSKKTTTKFDFHKENF